MNDDIHNAACDLYNAGAYNESMEKPLNSLAAAVDAELAAVLGKAAKLAIKLTAVPRDVLGPATAHMKAQAAVGEKLAAAILALATTRN